MYCRKVKKLADSDSEEDSALSWVKKVRRKENEKQLAARRAQLLEEMDEEFGVGDLVDNVMGIKPKVSLYFCLFVISTNNTNYVQDIVEINSS